LCLSMPLCSTIDCFLPIERHAFQQDSKVCRQSAFV
jgi:hypothetical protein